MKKLLLVFVLCFICTMLLSCEADRVPLDSETIPPESGAESVSTEASSDLQEMTAETEGSSEPSIGDTVCYLISFDENPGIASVILRLSYNTNLLTLQKAEYLGSYAEGGEEVDVHLIPATLAWCDLGNVTEKDFVKLSFTVSAEIESLEAAALSVTYDAGDICDLEENDVELSFRYVLVS